MSTFNPPPRNVAAYGDRRDVACAQLCSSTHNYAQLTISHTDIRSVSFFFNMRINHAVDQNQKVEFFAGKNKGTLYNM